ncbi:hypothetical protein D3C78_1095180 [compost metagenome]
MQAFSRLVGLFHGLSSGLAAGIDDIYCSLRVAVQALDHVLDLRGGLLGALGQQAHFVCYHSEAATLFASARRLDGGVQREQVGLLGDGADHFQHAADLGTFPGQALDHLDGLADGIGQLVDLEQAAVDVVLAPTCLLFGLANFVGRVLGVLRHFLHGVGDLMDGGSDQLHLLRLLLAVVLAIGGDFAE